MSDPELVSFSTYGPSKESLQQPIRIRDIGLVTPIRLQEFYSTPDFVLFKDWITSKTPAHYIITSTVYISFECPLSSAQYVLIAGTERGNLSTYSILGQVTVTNDSETTLIVDADLAVETHLIFAFLDYSNHKVDLKSALKVDSKSLGQSPTSSESARKVKTLAVTGNITLDSTWDQLNAYNAYDMATKVEYITTRPSIALYPYGPLRPVQYTNPSNPPVPPNPYSVYPWTSNVIPFDKVPHPIPPTLPNGDAYDKYQSIPTTLGFYAGLDFLTLPPNDPEVILFLTNYANRGVDNYKKKVYMTALTTAVVPFYKDKTDNFLNQLVANITMYNQPVLSSFQSALIKYFLALHVGYDNYPEYVTQYFAGFLDIIGIGNPTDPHEDAIIIYGNSIVKQVRAYFQERINIVIQNEDRTCFTYWWNMAGLPIESMVIEAVHNIFAFSQYNNITFLAIRDVLMGTPNLLDPPNTITYDFFDLINQAQTETDKINVVREFMRIMSPNPASFSKVQLTKPDHTNPVVTSRLIHQEIMIENTPGGPQNYYVYNTDQYNDFPATFHNCTSRLRCPVTNSVLDNLNPEDLFTVSPVDNQTVLDVANPNMMPVYQYPQYAPFGLGYRRCAGEILNYMTIIKILEKLSTVTFQFVTPPPTDTLITVGPFVQVPDNIYAISP